MLQLRRIWIRCVVVATVSTLMSAVLGCPQLNPSSMSWRSTTHCNECDRALHIAVLHMQMLYLERAQRLGIADAAGAATEWASRIGNEFAEAIPDRVCSESDGWTVMFVMPSGVCVGVEVAGDGRAQDID